MLGRLTQKGCVEMIGGQLVVDVMSVQELTATEFGASRKVQDAIPQSKKDQFGDLLQGGKYKILSRVFEGRNVVSKEEWKKASLEGRAPSVRPLLYQPRTKADAYSPERIKQQEAWLYPWSMKGMQHDWNEKIQFKDGALTLEELTITGMIYHPSLGDGVRNEQGRLMVKSHSGKDAPRERVSGAWFKKQGVYGGSVDEGGVSLHAPGRWLAVHPEFVERGILRESDFVNHSRHSSDDARGIVHARYVERMGTVGAGYVMFNGVNHFLGREYKNRQDLLLVNVATDIGLCAERSEAGEIKPLFTFRLFQKTDPEMVELQKQGKFLQVGIGLIEKRPLTEEMLKNASSTDARIRAVHAYLGSRKNVVNQRTSVDRSRRLSPETLQAITSWLAGMRETQLAVYQPVIDRYGELGAKFLLLFRDAEKNDAYQFFKRAGSYGEAAVQALMSRCVSLQEKARQDTQALLEQYFPEASIDERLLERELTQEVGRRWKLVLGQLATEKHVTFEQLQVRLGSLEKENALFASLFRMAFKGKNAKQAFELVDGLTFDTVTAREMDARTKKEMLQIFDTNWVDQDQIAAKSFKGVLEKKLSDETGSTKFYLLKKQGEIMAYIRFDDRPDLEANAVYGGSLNVHPVFRQSGIGEAMMQKTIDEVAKEHVIYAHVVPDAVVGSAYVEQMKCVITGVDVAQDQKQGQGAPILRLRRDDHRIYRTRATETSWEALKAGAVPGVEVKQYDLLTQREQFLSAVRALAPQGKVITRYLVERQRPSVRWIAIEREVDVAVGTPSPTAQET